MASARGDLPEPTLVAPLVRILADLFGSASDLYHDLKRKRNAVPHEGEDRHRRLSRFRRHRDSSSDSDSHGDRRRKESRNRSKSRRRDSPSDADEESIRSSAAIVRGEYERGYKRLGERFAKGDLLAQNQLQAQVIAMQQAIIDIYQQNERLPATDSLLQLYQATRSARAGSAQALSDLYHRLESSTEIRIPERLPLTESSSNELVIQTKTTSRSRSRRRASHGDRPPPGHGLFCHYAVDLQRYPNQQLASVYREGGSGCCPYCRVHLGTRPGKAWEITLDDPRSPDGVKTFLIGNRFVIKCHREGGGFACVLCSEFREYDTVCVEIADLVDHIWKEHRVEDLEEDEDAVEA